MARSTVLNPWSSRPAFSDADEVSRHRFFDREAVGGHRQHRCGEDAKQTGGKHAALAKVLVSRKLLRHLVAIMAYARPHAVVKLVDNDAFQRRKQSAESYAFSKSMKHIYSEILFSLASSWNLRTTYIMSTVDRPGRRSG